MAISASKFEEIKNRARKLIKEDAKNDSHVIQERNAERARFLNKSGSGAIATPYDNMAPSYGSNGSSIGTISENYSDDNNDALYSAMDNRMQQFVENRNTQRMHQPIQTQQTAPTQRNKNLPREILESFSNNYIDQSALNPDRPVLDRIGITDGYQEPINEVVQQPQQTNTVNAKVDYELIKNIVESTVKKYMGALTKKILNESKSNENNIAAVQFTGDKFVIVAKNGDLYEANMVFKKNVNKK